jgi:hypothetical protein
VSADTAHRPHRRPRRVWPRLVGELDNRRYPHTVGSPVGWSNLPHRRSPQ